MQIFILTDTGCETACAKEVKELINKECEERCNVCIVECTREEACFYAYNSKVARHVLIGVHAPTTLDALGNPEHIEELLPSGCTFKVVAEVLQSAGEVETLTQEVIETLGDWLFTRINHPVSLQNPDVKIRAALLAHGLYVGVDVIGFPLAKREWRIMLNRQSLKATIAAAACRYADLQPGHVILDPYGHDGTLAIEAAMYLSKRSHFVHAKQLTYTSFPSLEEIAKVEEQETEKIHVYVPQVRDVKGVKMNAKLAGVEKRLHITKADVDWIDMKLEEGSVDRIITQAPVSGRSMPLQKCTAILEKLFERADTVLAPDGTLTIITIKPEELPKKWNVVAKHELYMGKLPVHCITFRR